MPVPEIISEVLDRDCSHFGLSKEKLCNEIILKLGYKPLTQYHKLMTFEKKVELQFNLQVETEKYYFDIYRENNASSDAELVRTILSTYINMAPFLREKLIMDSKLRFIVELLKDKYTVKIDQGDEIIESRIIKIERCPVTHYLKVVYDKGEEYLSKIKIIKK